MFRIGIFFIALSLRFTMLEAQQKFSVTSPDKTVGVEVIVTDSVRYSLWVDHQEVIGKSVISVQTDKVVKPGWRVTKSDHSFINEKLSPVVHQKERLVPNVCNQLQISFANGLTLEWRAYNNGVAWRWVLPFKGTYQVVSETANYSFDKNGRSWYPEEDGFYSHNERIYKNYTFADINPSKLASLPVLFESKGVKVLLTESDLYNYAGMWVRGKGLGDGQIRGVFANYPKTKEITSDRDEKVTEREDCIAKLNGPQQLPWRVLMVAREDQELLTNELVYLLSKPSAGDYSWVKPGKAQWDWWNANNVYNVDFQAGVNTATYKYYIDFASRNGLEYVILDEGWSDPHNLLKTSPDIDMEELSRYAGEKHVRLILWTTWLALRNQMEQALDQFAAWKVAGIKVDFMQRDDQEMVNYYERVAQEASKRRLLVDFHGAYKPTGWSRMYPNVITSEGVFGNEQSKWDPEKRISPDHNLNLPFIRMAAGPMDYTPGAMLNAQKDDWKPMWNEPMSLGTRCHQLAMYVVYESPLQMLCDNPTHYSKEPECMEFLRAVPSVWDSTVAFPSKVGEFVLLAHRAANGDWYLGAMTNWTARELTCKLSFLGSGKFRMYSWKDGINAERNGKDFRADTMEVSNQTVLTLKLAKGGGFAARIVPVNP